MGFNVLKFRFTEGEVLKVFGSKDSDGYYEAINTDGEHGLVPGNMLNFDQNIRNYFIKFSK